MASRDNDSHIRQRRYPLREPEQRATPVGRSHADETFSPIPSSSEETSQFAERPPRSHLPVRRSSSSESRSSLPARQPDRRPVRHTQTKERSSYKNPELSHDMNVTQQSEAVVFFKVLAKIIFLIVFLFLVIYFSFRLLTPYIPYSFETKISQNFIHSLLPKEEDEIKYRHAKAELQLLAEQLARHMDAPSDMPLHIHISSDRDLNAFATLGGHIIINKGTIDAVTSENSLAMVLAHEIAHVKNRDPITGLGTSTLFSLLLTIVTGSDSGFALVGSVTELSFSRQQESQADADALVALRGHYGHTQGADEFFSLILTQYGSAMPPEFLSSHPDTKNRLMVIRQDQNRIGPVKPLRPLSENLKAIQNDKPERSRRSRRSRRN